MSEITSQGVSDINHKPSCAKYISVLEQWTDGSGIQLRFRCQTCGGVSKPWKATEPILALRTEMKCRVCGCFSSAQTCWHCATNQGVAALSAQLEWLWANCRIIYWPKDGSYPIEHNPNALKYGRDIIEHQMSNNL